MMELVLTDDETGTQTEPNDEASKADAITYSVFGEEIDSPASELGRYRTYSVRACDANGKTVKVVHDVTCDRAKLETLVTLCNRSGLALCHLDDVIEDFLG